MKRIVDLLDFNFCNPTIKTINIYLTIIVLLVGAFVLLFGFLLFIIFSYLIIKFLRLGVDQMNIFFNKFNKKSQSMLDCYGNYEIKKIYMVREPIGHLSHLLLNIITFDYKTILKNIDKPVYHSFLLLHIKRKSGKGKKKILLLEKNNSINITDRIFLSERHEIKSTKIKEKITLQTLLDTTKERIGNKTFFNWNFYNNNCQIFCKEIMTTLKGDENIKEKELRFFFQQKRLHEANPSDFTLHIVNCLFFLYNFAETYICSIPFQSV
jgi:hypothetical protein